MIFSGDIACPNIKSLPKINVPIHLKNKNWVANLEGAIEETDTLKQKTIVFNHLEMLKCLGKQFNFVALSLANNHSTDSSSIVNTKRYLKALDIPCFGAGINKDKAKETLEITENNQKITLLNFGWEAINCVIATSKKQGINAYSKANVLEQVLFAKQKHPSNKCVCVFHWNYELEQYPQPLDRDLSKQLIDLGVDAVIGCHAHRVQGAEIYKGKPIVYGLGNWVFPQYEFWNGSLHFPDFCKLQLAFEINWDTNIFWCHWFNYDKENNVINFIKSEKLFESPKIKELSPFENMSSSAYKKWFKSNRFQKKMLPVFYFNDSQLLVKIKFLWIQFRHFIIMKLVQLNLK